MENNSESEVMEKETIRIKMRDGMSKTLANITHVPELKRYLISLGTLESLRCTTKGRVIKVSKGAPVLMKANRSRSLYVFKDLLL